MIYQIFVKKKKNLLRKELFMRKATGYVSFVRGENPYTFPYRVYHDIFDNSHTFNEQPVSLHSSLRILDLI